MAETIAQVTINADEVFAALSRFIIQRPGVDPRNYCDPWDLANGRRQTYMDGYRAYRSELRDIAKDRKRALAALETAKELQPANPAVLLDAFRAFSGRLQWTPYLCPICGEHTSLKTERTANGRLIGYCGDAFAPEKWFDGPYHLTYCTGQYYPTEYRKAAATVLETYIADWKRAANSASPKVFTYRDMADVRAANKAVGEHWFDRSTMRFFNTRIESGLIAGKWFVSSERMDDDHPRLYTVRQAMPDGSIDTVGEFQGYQTAQDARAAIQELRAKEGK